MEERIKDVPYLVHESAMARYERVIRRLIIALIVSIVVTLVCNMVWIAYISEYDFTCETSTETVDVDAKYGNANYIRGNGDIVNGKSTGNQEKNREKEDS